LESFPREWKGTLGTLKEPRKTSKNMPTGNAFGKVFAQVKYGNQQNKGEV
jgi:hypothetical protein